MGDYATRVTLTMLLILALAPPSWSLIGDMDESGMVDGWDLILFGQAFGTNDGEPHWNASADLDKSGTVDGADLALLISRFGQTGDFDTRAGLYKAKGPDHLPDQIIVQFLPHMGTDDIRGAAAALGGQARDITPHFATVGIDLSAGDSLDAAIARFESDPQVVYAEPDHLRYLSFRPNDPFFPNQWHYQAIDYESGLDVVTGANSNVIVAVIDTGVAYEDYGQFRRATDLAGTRFVPGPDLVNNDGHPNDEGGGGFGHGTFVAGVIAQTTNNNFGGAGIAFNATIMPIRVFPRNGGTPDSKVAQAIDAAVGGGAKIINMSLSGPGFSVTLRDAVRRAYRAGVTMVASTGNEAQDPEFTGDSGYPAAFSEVIGVAATDVRGRRAPYSNHGPSVDVAAPGGDLSRDDNNDGSPDGVLAQSFQNNQYTRFQFFWAQGTSFAAPHVAGIAALLYARGVTNPETIKTTILYSARDVGPDGRDNDTGFGIASARRALEGLGPD